MEDNRPVYYELIKFTNGCHREEELPCLYFGKSLQKAIIKMEKLKNRYSCLELWKVRKHNNEKIYVKQLERQIHGF